MAVTTVSCPDCGAPVPYGRLSCVACGALLASVAGAPRPTAAPAETSRPSRGSNGRARTGERRRTPARTSAASTGGDGSTATSTTPPATEPSDRRVAGDRPAASPPAATKPADPVAQPGPGRRAFEPVAWPPPLEPSPARVPVATRPAAQVPAAPVPTAAPAAAPPGASVPFPTATAATSSASAVVTTGAGPATLGAGQPVDPVRVAGAYLPPSATFGDAPAARPDSSSRSGARSSEASPGPLTLARLGDLRLEAPADLPAWFVAAGSVAAIVGFVLPWGSNGMVGGGPEADFFSRWGLANAANVIPLVLAFAALYLQLGTDVPRTVLRTGAVGLALGGLLSGFVFVYATSAFGLGTGGTVVAVGGVGLAVGGLLALVPRHPLEEPRV